MGWHEVIKYVIDIPVYRGLYGAFMNLDSWNQLPDDLQAVLQVATEAMEYDYGRYFHEDINTLFLKKAAEYGTMLIDLPLEDVAAIREIAAQLWDEVATESPGAAQIVQIMKEYLGVE